MKKDEDISVVFGRNLRKFRTDKNLSQENLARLVGFDGEETGAKNYISRYELGKSVVNIELLIKYCEVLEVSIDDLLGQSDSTLVNRVIHKKTKDLIAPKNIPVFAGNMDKPYFSIIRAINTDDPNDYFYFDIADNSLEKLCIIIGRKVLFVKRSRISDGKIVLAKIKDTDKFVVRVKDGHHLRPTIDGYESILTKDVELIAMAVEMTVKL